MSGIVIALKQDAVPVQWKCNGKAAVFWVNLMTIDIDDIIYYRKLRYRYRYYSATAVFFFVFCFFLSTGPFQPRLVRRNHRTSPDKIACRDVLGLWGVTRGRGVRQPSRHSIDVFASSDTGDTVLPPDPVFMKRSRFL